MTTDNALVEELALPEVMLWRRQNWSAVQIYDRVQAILARREAQAAADAAAEVTRLKAALPDMDALKATFAKAAEACTNEPPAAAYSQREADAARIAALREWVAKLHKASGCSCCRDDEGWEAASDALGALLGIPRYSDDSGYDFRAALTPPAALNLGETK
jgi:hypothetical protein